MSPPPPASSGNYHALLIGIDKYKAFPDLETPVSDAKALGEELTEGWGFQTRELTDERATFARILRALDDYRRTLTADDSLLIYFAGHGQFLEDALGRKEGFWMPSDALAYDEKADQIRTWLSSRQIAQTRQLSCCSSA